jgi:hypothetical protein
MLIQELLSLLESTDSQNHTSPDGVIKFILDFSDPEEREADIWVKGATSEQQAQEIFANYSAFINKVLEPHELSMWDAEVVHGEEVDGGWTAHVQFPPEDNELEESKKSFKVTTPGWYVVDKMDCPVDGPFQEKGAAAKAEELGDGHGAMHFDKDDIQQALKESSETRDDLEAQEKEALNRVKELAHAPSSPSQNDRLHAAELKLKEIKAKLASLKESSIIKLDEKVFGTDRYDWYVWSPKKPSKMFDRRGGAKQIEHGMTFGLRAATSKPGTWRMVMKAKGPSIIFTISAKDAQDLINAATKLKD